MEKKNVFLKILLFLSTSNYYHGGYKKLAYFKLLPVDQIDFDNRYYDFRQNLMGNGLAKSIEDEGLLHPIILRKESDSEYIIVSGHRRALVFKELRKKEINAYVFEKDEHSEEKFLKIAIAENTKRKDLEPVEIAKALETLKEQLNLSHNELAEQFGEVFGLGKSPKKVENYLKLNLLDDQLKDRINSGNIKPEIGFEIGMLEETEDREEIQQLLLNHDNKLSRSHIHEVIENAKKLKIDNEMDSFKEVFEKKGLNDLINNTDLPNRVNAFVQQLNREANPDKALLLDTIEKKIDAIYDLAQNDSEAFKGKMLIKKSNIEKKGVAINLTLSTPEDLFALIRLFQGAGGKLLREVIDPSIQNAVELEATFI